MLKWFTKKKDSPSKSKSVKDFEVPQRAQSTYLKLKKKCVLPVNFAKKVIDLEI